MKKDETLIQDEIIQYLNDCRILHWRISNSQNMAGFPDILACYDGLFIGLEVKTPKGKPTMQQMKVIEDIGKSGGAAAIVKSVDDVRQFLAYLDGDMDKLDVH